MKRVEISGGWRFVFAENRVCRDTASSVRTVSDAEKIGKAYNASVPGCIELDMYGNKLGKEPFFGNNSWDYQKLENLHVWYFTVFKSDADDARLVFEGLDTVADIYVNGELYGHSENMYLPFTGEGCIKKGENEIVIHFSPVCIEARKRRLPAECNTLFYNHQALYIRKPMHMYGWDIMPRFVSCGIWKPVYLETEIKKNRISELFLYTLTTDTENNRAKIRIYFALELDDDFPRDYRFELEGVCGDSRFSDGCSPRSTEYNRLAFWVENCRFWWPKNQGKPELYEVKARLYKGDVLCDERDVSFGIRTVELSRTDCVDENGGDFSFIVNGRRIFVMGTNWVPMSPFHSEDVKRLPKALALLDGSGCNMVRMWGGNVYESDEFFDFCDRHGIMVWQDFAMACASYPKDNGFLNSLAPEIEYTVKRLRGHASLAVWSGDNECDEAYTSWGGIRRDPDENIITREFIPRILRAHDFTRPYIPSSPYLTHKCFSEKKSSPEAHLWGPRDYFKSDFYKESECYFASEIGYHGCPSPGSLVKFIGKDELYPIMDKDGEPNLHWLAHATECQSDGEIPYKYRLKLLENHVKLLFGYIPDNIEDFARMSQISQAEAFKYFIESFRIRKWRRTGIIWWNLLDGWPQISDAVIDYYYCEKLAYKFIKRSQTKVCLMFDEPENGVMPLYAVNDGDTRVSLDYTVYNVTGKTEVLKGTVTLEPNENRRLESLNVSDGEHTMYLIRWDGDAAGKNHYYTNLKGVDYEKYLSELRFCGFDEFENFDISEAQK